MPTTTAGAPPEWKRLGDLLTERRVHLGYRERTRFCAERGVDYRLVYDIEQARRANFTRGTIAALEVAYALRPGAIRAALAGGDLEPEPKPEASQPHREAVPGGDLDYAARIFPDDSLAQGLFRRGQRLGNFDELAELFEWRAERAARGFPEDRRNGATG